MNTDIEVGFLQGDDSEEAHISIRSCGIVSELRFHGANLDAVGHFTSADVRRLFEALAEAERRRVDPDRETVRCIDYLRDRFDFLDEDKTRLYLNVEIVMPIAACGSVKLQPNIRPMSPEGFSEDDGSGADDVHSQE